MVFETAEHGGGVIQFRIWITAFMDYFLWQEMPKSVLSKKNSAICYHQVWEGQVAEILRVAWIQGKYNQAELGTKTTITLKM